MNALIRAGAASAILAATVAFPLIFATNASAQEAEAERVIVTGESVIVTGSLIPTTEEIGSSPVSILNRDSINKSGQGTTTEQLLKSLPITSANSIPVQNNASAAGGPPGAASVSLRGFDPGATLVLMGGRRVAPYPGTSPGGAAFFDLNTIPIAAIQSIEIQKDGASTTYGADAVAGVINLKLYKDYRGAQVTLYYGNTLDKDAGEYAGDILFGTGDDKTSITGDIFFYHRNSMFNRDRGNSNRPPYTSPNSSPYNLQLSSDVVAAAGGENLNPGGFEFATPPNFTNGLVPASNYIYSTNFVRAPFDALLPGFNFNAFSNSFPDQERWGGYTAFEHKICDDQFRIFGDFYYADVKTHDELAPPATGPFENPGQGTLYIPPHSPLPGGVAPPNTPTIAETGMPPDAYNPFNPFEQIISGFTMARLADFGNRLVEEENIAELFTVGVKGDKLFDGSWGYDGAFRYSQIEDTSELRNVSVSRFNRILNAADSIYNPTSADFIGTTIPYNPFGDFRVPIATNQRLIDFAIIHARDLNTSKLATLDLNIYSTDLFDLPAGGVGLAFGGIFIRESLTENPDDENRNKDSVGVGQEFPVKAGRKEYALYAETLIPIFSPKWKIPFFYSLEFTAGGRFEAFNNDTNSLVPKVGIRWQPFDEQLTLRSTWGEGFVEPSLTELYGPVIFGFDATSFMGDRNPETATLTTPNPHLGPERSRNWTGGIVYTPKWIPAGTLTLTIDLWDIERTGVVMTDSPQSVIERFLTGKLQPGEAVHLDPSGNFVSEVVSPFVNGGRQSARGVDLGIQYQLTTRFGTFTSLTRATYLDQFVFQFKGDRAWQVAGRTNGDWWGGSDFGIGGDAWYKWKGLSTLDWTWHNFDLNTTVHLLDGFWEEIYAKKFDGFWKQHYVHPTWFTDAQLSYSLIFTPPVETAPVAGYSKDSKAVEAAVSAAVSRPTLAYAMPCWKKIVNNSTVTVGVNNIFGEDPPHEFGYEFGSGTGYPEFAYDNLGRFWYVRLIKKF